MKTNFDTLKRNNTIALNQRIEVAMNNNKSKIPEIIKTNKNIC